MINYLDLVKTVLESGEPQQDRTGVGTQALFGAQLRFDLRQGFPLITTKKVIMTSVVRELLWFIAGKTNINDGLNCKIWDEWADKNGDLGPIYGHQWRQWAPNIDQLSQLLDSLKTTPQSRRHIISTWNVADLPKMALPPCHILFQCYVYDGHLDCQLYQRSADLALGVPFNIASYALLQHLIAQDCSLTPRYFIHTFGNVHIYQNHVDGLREQLTRQPKLLPTLQLKKKPSLFDITEADITLQNYTPHPFIPFKVAV